MICIFFDIGDFFSVRINFRTQFSKYCRNYIIGVTIDYNDFIAAEVENLRKVIFKEGQTSAKRKRERARNNPVTSAKPETPVQKFVFYTHMLIRI
jgi:hypothetical protein